LTKPQIQIILEGKRYKFNLNLLFFGFDIFYNIPGRKG